MSEFWVVLSESNGEHASFEAAEAERAALQSHLPEKSFRVVRCKRWLRPAHHFPKLVELVRQIVDGGLTDQLRDQARIVLGTIATRNETPHLTRNFSIPEFKPRDRR